MKITPHFDTRYMVGEEHALEPTSPLAQTRLPHPEDQMKAQAWLRKHHKKVRSRAYIDIRWTSASTRVVESAKIVSYDYKPAAFQN